MDELTGVQAMGGNPRQLQGVLALLESKDEGILWCANRQLAGFSAC
jgi:hypothetical protein